jgi:hypothetical protein
MEHKLMFVCCYRTSGRHTPRMFLSLTFAEAGTKCSVDSDYLSFVDCEKDGTRDFQVWGRSTAETGQA